LHPAVPPEALREPSRKILREIVDIDGQVVEHERREAGEALIGGVVVEIDAGLVAIRRGVSACQDATTRERIERYLDVPAFVTLIAAENFLAENDGLVATWG
jgi:hypothetical protein